MGRATYNSPRAGTKEKTMRTATYHYRLRDYRGRYTRHAVKVEIIGERDRSYQVRYLEPGSYRDYAGTVKWVRKNNVRITAMPVETWLPYKD